MQLQTPPPSFLVYINLACPDLRCVKLNLRCVKLTNVKFDARKVYPREIKSIWARDSLTSHKGLLYAHIKMRVAFQYIYILSLFFTLYWDRALTENKLNSISLLVVLLCGSTCTNTTSIGVWFPLGPLRCQKWMHSWYKQGQGALVDKTVHQVACHITWDWTCST